MTSVDTSAGKPADTAWHAQETDAVIAALGSDRERGLSAADAAKRLSEHGPNAIAAEKPPSVWQVALRQLADPMNVMLVAVAIISLFINQVSVGLLVGALVILNVVLGTRQEMKAKASVDALAKMQIPQAKVIRDGALLQVDATSLVPGDILALEAGDIVPADGRILRSATLETQEAALTGESAPIAKDAGTLPDPDTTLGDRTDMVFQNTQVTRGTASAIVTDTGMQTQMGRIASMLSSVKPAKSPLQRELDSLTGVLGWIAWGAVAIIIVTGLLRGQEIASVILLGISMAISAIPTGMPSFVQAMLSYGSRQLAEHKAVVKNLTDVETLGATSAINSDKTGTLTMNEMTVETLYYRGVPLDLLARHRLARGDLGAGSAARSEALREWFGELAHEMWTVLAHPNLGVLRAAMAASDAKRVENAAGAREPLAALNAALSSLSIPVAWAAWRAARRSRR